MWQDPIVQETRGLREAFAAQYGHDADAIFQVILEKQAHSQRPKVSYAPNTPVPMYAAQPCAPEDAPQASRP
ncbi:hypothetical protein Cenrod_0070 [Candidatus Symbiobacter mobilis CR]|uniref:Uncharacterized protein n=1 Tax=Candidatus Symbiobacter mobilis CR TaxID=946483 RepID=U5N4L9_9BURK|nr:hypothetical protein Cenrod_0070 [Candidatus Symbiobacter mobilis CR]